MAHHALPFARYWIQGFQELLGIEAIVPRNRLSGKGSKHRYVCGLGRVNYPIIAETSGQDESGKKKTSYPEIAELFPILHDFTTYLKISLIASKPEGINFSPEGKLQIRFRWEAQARRSILLIPPKPSAYTP